MFLCFDFSEKGFNKELHYFLFKDVNHSQNSCRNFLHVVYIRLFLCITRKWLIAVILNLDYYGKLFVINFLLNSILEILHILCNPFYLGIRF